MQSVLWVLGQTVQTSETKAMLFAALWAVASRFIPAIPLSLPPMDFGDAGILTLSPVVLAVYVLGRVGVKTFTKGQVPFWPTKEDAPDA